MTIEEKMLAIEIERLEMEKKRDRHASLRFLIGSVLLAVGTTGASLYINSQQESRSLVNGERQWIVPILMSTNEDDFESRIEKIDSFLKLELSDKTTKYLKSERDASVEAKAKLEKKTKEELAARRLAEAKEAQALAAKRAEEEAERASKAKQLAQQEAEMKKAEAARAKAEREAAEKAAKEAAAKAAREEAERKALVQQLMEERMRRFNVY